MTDQEFIGYCDIHCQTERALFSGKDVNRMLALAGHPEGFVREVPSDSWFSLHEPMRDLVKHANARLADLKGGFVLEQTGPQHLERPAVSNVIPLKRRPGPSL